MTGTGPCSAWIDDVYLRRVGDLQSLRDPNADVKNLTIRNDTIVLTLSAETLTIAATDHTVQRTRFAGCLQITVNFGAEPAKLQTGETLAPMRWLLRE